MIHLKNNHYFIILTQHLFDINFIMNEYEVYVNYYNCYYYYYYDPFKNNLNVRMFNYFVDLFISIIFNFIVISYHLILIF
jgi:hypothetical protein